MNEFTKLRKATRRKAVERGIVKRVVEITGKDKSTVSRTLAGKIDNPSPEVAAALREFIDSMQAERGTAA
jgi:hypothetical protein